MNSRLLRMKIAIVGEPTSGKTAYTQMVHSGGVSFPKKYAMTVGAEFSVKEVSVGVNMEVETIIFDVSGHELYRQFAPTYLRNISAFIVMYDISNKTTFETCKKWVEMCRAENKNTPGFLLANKIDLIEKAEVTDLQGETFARAHQLRYLKGSALRGVGITEPIEELARAHQEAFVDRCHFLEGLR